MKMYLNALYRVLFVLSVITMQFSETAIQKRLFQKMDDLEFAMREENLKRHEEIRELRQIVNRMEEQMNNSMAILDRRNSEISDTDSPSHQVKTEQLDSRKIAEVLRTFKILKRGFSEEKKVTSRLRRHVTELQSQIAEQQKGSSEFSKGIANIIDAVTTVSNILHNMKSEITDIKENGIIMSAEISTSNQRCSQIDETLTTEITKSLDFLKISRQKMEAFHNEMQMFGCRKDNITELQNQLNYKCEGAPYTSCKKIYKAGCTLSGVYKLSLETGTEQVIHKLAAWFKT